MTQGDKLSLNLKWVLYVCIAPLAYAVFLGSLWITVPVAAAALYAVWRGWTKLLGPMPTDKGKWEQLGYECSFWLALGGILIGVPYGLEELGEDSLYGALASVYTSAIWLAGSLVPYYAAKPLDKLVNRKSKD